MHSKQAKSLSASYCKGADRLFFILSLLSFCILTWGYQCDRVVKTKTNY